MKVFRFLRIGFATVVALGSTLPATLVGCATRNKEPDSIAPPPTHGDPPPHMPSYGDPVHLMPTLLFAVDKATLSPQSKAALDELCAEMKKWPQDTVILEGHTSDLGAEDYNMALGLRRAEAAKAYLIEQGIAAQRIEVSSLGETDPAVPNDSPANRKLNQRVILRYCVEE